MLFLILTCQHEFLKTLSISSTIPEALCFVILVISPGGGGGGGEVGYSLISAILVYAAPKGYVFCRFGQK